MSILILANIYLISCKKRRLARILKNSGSPKQRMLFIGKIASFGFKAAKKYVPKMFNGGKSKPYNI